MLPHRMAQQTLRRSTLVHAFARDIQQLTPASVALQQPAYRFVAPAAVLASRNAFHSQQR